MHLKIKVSQIDSAGLYIGDNKVRDAQITPDLLDLINSLEIDVDMFIVMKNSVKKNKGLEKLIKVMDLKLLL